MENKDPNFDLIIHKDLVKNIWPSCIDEYKKNTEHQSLMVKAITKDKFQALKNIKTQAANWTIARSINTGTLYPESFTGCHAGDHESYIKFADFFNPVIEGHHTGFKIKEHKHITDLNIENITDNLTKKAQEKIISTRIRLSRNLDFFPLNPGGTKETRIEIAQLLEKVVSKFQDDLKGNFYLHSKMSKEQSQQLIDDHFLFRGKDRMQAASGYHQHWPIGRGVFLSQPKQFVMWVNEGDHLRIISMEKGGDVKKVFERLGRAVRTIESILKEVTGKETVFMSDPTLGMITCCPSNLGTGMRASFHILVPKLIKKLGLNGIDKFAHEMNCQARGSSGEHSDSIDRIDISNWRRLGFKECDLIQDMINCANKLAEMQDEILVDSDDNNLI